MIFMLGLLGVIAIIIAPTSYVMFNGYNLPYEPMSAIHILIWFFIFITVVRAKYHISFIYKILMPLSLLISTVILLVGNTESATTTIDDLRETGNSEQFKGRKEVKRALQIIYKDGILLKKEEWFFYSILNKNKH